MYVCIYVYVYMCMYVRTHMNIESGSQVVALNVKRSEVYVCMYVYVCVCMHEHRIWQPNVRSECEKK